MRKKQVRKNKYVIPAIVVGLVFLVAGMAVVKAGGGGFSWDKVEQWAGLAIADKVDNPEMIEETFGAFPGPEIYEKLYFLDGFLGDSNIDIPLLQGATTTPAGTTIVYGSYCADIDTLMVNNWWWELQTANGLWGVPDFTIGTTTRAGHNSFTNTTTDTLVTASQIPTSTTGIFSLWGYIDSRYSNATYNGGHLGTSTIGSFYADRNNQLFASSSPFILEDGDCIVIASDQGGATSSDSFLSSGNWTTYVGKFHADAVYR